LALYFFGERMLAKNDVPEKAACKMLVKFTKGQPRSTLFQRLQVFPLPGNLFC